MRAHSGHTRRLILAAVAALALAACDRPQAQQTKAAPQAPPPPTVTVSQPLARPFVEWDEYTGRFDAMETVEVRARVSGYLKDVEFKDGQIVKAGDLLYQIDPRPFERVLEQAKAERDFAATKVENASRDVDRGRPLVERRVMSEKVFDDRTAVKREAEAQVKMSEAKIAAAELDLAFTRITAPITGRISRSAVSVGNYVIGGGTSSSSSTLLTTIVSQDPIHIYIDVSERNYLKYMRLAQAGRSEGGVAMGAPVELQLQDERGFPHKGRLDFVDNRLDPATGTMRARAMFDNKSGLFSAGMFARVRLAGSGMETALLLPDEAIGTDQANRFVFVVAADGTPSRRPVTLGPIHAGLRVIRTGLTAEDWVVTNGLMRMRGAQKVTPKREPMKLSPDAPPTAPEVRGSPTGQR